MKSSALGKNTLEVEVLNISVHGVWIFVRNREYFLGYKEFPWFRTATLGHVMNVELLHDHHLYWPDLDVDLDLKTLETPASHPLIYQ